MEKKLGPKWGPKDDKRRADAIAEIRRGAKPYVPPTISIEPRGGQPMLGDLPPDSRVTFTVDGHRLEVRVVGREIIVKNRDGALIIKPRVANEVSISGDDL